MLCDHTRNHITNPQRVHVLTAQLGKVYLLKLGCPKKVKFRRRKNAHFPFGPGPVSKIIYKDI